MTDIIITPQRITTEIHIVWDGAFCFLNQKKNGRIIDDATRIALADAKAIITKTQKDQNATDISGRGCISFDSPKNQWSWMATIIEEVEPNA